MRPETKFTAARPVSLDNLVWTPPPLTQRHRDRISLKSAWIRARKLTERYSARLRKIARHVDDIVKGFDATTAQGQAFIQASLLRYRDALTPWAEHAADTFVKEVAAADENAWRRQSAEIGRGIVQTIASAPIAPVLEKLKREQVILITSLPKEAAERVADRVRIGIAQGLRAEVVAEEIYKTGAVTMSRARLIARTESGRAATTLQAARAQHAGSTRFRWVSAGDSDVRPSHKRLSGQVFAWTDPPVCDAPDIRGLPGTTFNCRCVSLPIFDD